MNKKLSFKQTLFKHIRCCCVVTCSMRCVYTNYLVKSTGVIDDSGIRISITENLRPIDLGMLNLGLTTDFYQVIPPNQKDFVSKAYCSTDCITKVIPSYQYEIVNYALFWWALLLRICLIHKDSFLIQV